MNKILHTNLVICGIIYIFSFVTIKEKERKMSRKNKVKILKS